MAQLMSGDIASILPSALQPLARKILGQEEKAGPAGFLNSVSSMFGGGSGTGIGSGLFGGLGDLFKGSSSNGVLNNLSSAFGPSAASGANGILGGLSNLASGATSSASSASNGILGTLGNLASGAASGVSSAASSTGSAISGAVNSLK